jgi:hypothetical protein
VTAPVRRLGGGAAFAGDRIDLAVDLAARGPLDVLVLECLAERTIALGQGRRLRDAALGYEPRLDGSGGLVTRATVLEQPTYDVAPSRAGVDVEPPS